MTLLTESGRQAGAVDTAGGLVSRLDAGGQTVVVAAAVSREGTLKLISWRVAADGRTIDRLADSGDHAGTASLVALALASGAHLVSGVRTGDGNLKLIVWRLDLSSGALTRTGDSGDAGDACSAISIVESPHGDGNVIVSIAGPSGRLTVKNYSVSSTGHIALVGDSVADGQPSGVVSRVALCRGDGDKVLTAVRDSHGNLKLIAWRIGGTGHITRLADSGNLAGAIDDVDVCRSLTDRVVTAVRDSGNNLKLIVWGVSPDGAAIDRLGDSGDAAGGADHVACLDLPETDSPANATRMLITGVRTRESRIKVIEWRIAASGGVARVDDFGERTPPISHVEMAALKSGTFLTAVRARDDRRLTLVSWRRNDSVQPTVEAENLVLHNANFFENTAQVIPPGGPFPRGKVVLHLGQPRDAAGFVHRDLLDASNAIAINPTHVKVSYPLDTSVETNATDNQLIRLADGSLLAIKNGYIWSDLTPRPEWFDKVTIKGQTSKRARNAVFVFHSSDGGATWTRRSTIDSAVVFGGKYGWPQDDGDKGVGGFDRTEVYHDPWTGNVYVSGKGDGGPFTRSDGTTVSNHKRVILQSFDGGATWHGLAELGGSTILMTSTPAFALVALQRWDTQPRIYLLKPGSSTLGAGIDLVISEGGTPIPIGTDAGMDDLRQSPLDICRIGTSNVVRISVPVLNSSGRQVFEICNVAVADGSASLDRLTRIEARDPTTQSCFLGTFSHDNANPVTASADTTVFYWVEGPPKTASPNDLVARYKLFRGVYGQYVTGTLSVAAGNPRAFGRTGIGDYMKAGGYSTGSTRRLLAQWVEPTRVVGNVVTIHV